MKKNMYLCSCKNEKYITWHIVTNCDSSDSCYGNGFQTVIHKEGEIWKISKYPHL